jgi:hypothetical protein
VQQVARGITAVLLLALCSAARAAGSATFADLRSRIPEGLYEMRTVTDMARVPGIAAGTPPVEASSRQCVRDVAAGGFTVGRKAMEDSCRIDGLEVDSAGARYRMRCEDLESDVRLALVPGGYDMQIETLSYDGPKDRRLEQYVTTQKMQARFVGPCPKVPGS